jgi:hypothetical protein
LKVKDATPLGSLRITADDTRLLSQSGTALIPALAARIGLVEELSRSLAGLHRRSPVHDPGRIVCDLAAMLIDGGECVSDLGALADQPDLFGVVASHSTASRLLHALGPDERWALGEARGAARSAAWEAGAPPSEIVLDFDAHLLESHTEKEGAAPHRKLLFDRP